MSMEVLKDNNLVLLDLGGVLADLGDPVGEMQLELSNAEFWSRWLGSQAVRAFETGKISAEQFYAQVAIDLGIDDVLELKASFANWKLQLHEGIDQIIEDLRERNTVALLSNTNAVHWQQVRSTSSVFSSFSHLYLSFETGLFKPNIATYQRVIGDFGVDSARIFYFDDNQQFVDSAKTLGINAYRVEGLEQLRDVSKQVNLL